MSSMTEATLKNKTIMITGASRGIGREIALKCAGLGANIVIAAKTTEPHPKLEGTIYTVSEEIEKVGGRALPLFLDVRDDENIQQVMAEIEKQFKGLDVLVNNASAINLTSTLNTPMKRYDLMMSVNVRATFACSQAALPLLIKSSNPHILTISPPLNMQAKWFKNHCAYTMSKYGMSMCTMGLSEEFKESGIAINSLWPRTTIATAAIVYNFPKEMIAASRTPAIMADAAALIFQKNSKECTGNFFIDEDVLRATGVKSFNHYAVSPGQSLQRDLFVD